MASSFVTRYLPTAGVLLMLLALWLTTATHSHFSQDSWSYYELSRHIFTDFYRINTLRQLHFPASYGVSFPPLWPTLIASFNAMHDIGIYAGFVMNFAVAFATFLMLRCLSLKLFSSEIPGWFFFLSLMITPDYTTAIFSAGTIPLMILFTLAIVYLLLCNPTPSGQNIVHLALLAGLSTLTRFDFLLPALALGAAIFFLPRDKDQPIGRWLAILLYYGALLLVISPWIIYSNVQFGRFWLSDNTRPLLSAVPLFVRDFLPLGEPTLWTAPGMWLKKTIGAVIISSDVMITHVSALPFILLILGLSRPSLPRAIWVYALLIAAQLATILITGFVETRYYINLQLFLLVVITYFLAPMIHGRTSRFYLPLFTLICIAYSGAYFVKSHVQHAPVDYRFNANNQRPLEFEYLQSCLGKNPIIWLPPKNYSYKFGALTGTSNLIEPTNLGPDNASTFVRFFKLTHVLTENPKAYGKLAVFRKKPICTLKGWGESQSTYYLYKFY